MHGGAADCPAWAAAGGAGRGADRGRHPQGDRAAGVPGHAPGAARPRRRGRAALARLRHRARPGGAAPHPVDPEQGRRAGVAGRGPDHRRVRPDQLLAGRGRVPGAAGRPARPRPPARGRLPGLCGPAGRRGRAAPGRLPGRVQPARQHQLRRLAVLPGRAAAARARGDAGAPGHGPDRPAPLGRRGRRRPPLAGPGPAARAGPPPADADLHLERPPRGRPAPVPGLPAGPGRGAGGRAAGGDGRRPRGHPGQPPATPTSARGGGGQPGAPLPGVGCPGRAGTPPAGCWGPSTGG